nr:RNA-directed DNA polymerase, eukaryota, reverse transcriptase zinc-binding domain protein [Tanacetum cinerariifolium]
MYDLMHILIHIIPETFSIRLRGKVVLYHNTATNLKYHEFILYKAHNGRRGRVEGEVVATIGFHKDAPIVKPFLSIVGLGKGEGIVDIQAAVKKINGGFSGTIICVQRQGSSNKQQIQEIRFSYTNEFQKQNNLSPTNCGPDILFPPPSKVTSYTLAVQWPPGVCSGNSGVTCLIKPVPTEFTIHGLWPDPDDAPSTETFDANKIATLTSELNKNWPNLKSAQQSITPTIYDTYKLVDIQAAVKKINGGFSAKIKWAIEGDENTRFDKPTDNRVHIDMNFPKSITIDQQMDLECTVSKEELKRAVWECGKDKSPGPDGLSFSFYRQFWSSIKNDVFAAVSHFFTFRDIPNGCNSCFIALIPKVPDANLVKDFRPISLIGRINLSPLVNLSHMFYVDDAVSVGQWCNGNINNLVHVLECFFQASGLRINMCKSKIMGDNVGDEKVKSAASKLGCLIFNTLFSYLGTKAGGNMCRVQAWTKVVDKVWRFYSQKESLWVRVIKAIYGDDGQVGNVSKAGSRSCWRNIVNEMRILSNQGIKVLDYMLIKLRNRESTAFWDDNWIGGKVLKYSFLRIYALETGKEVTVNSKMSDTRLENSLRRSIRGGVEQVGLGEFSVASIWKIIDDNRVSIVDTRTLWIKCVLLR